MTKYRKVEVELPAEVADKVEAIPPPVRLTEDYLPNIGEIIKQARESAEAEFTEWLKEKDRINQYATKRQELMMSCTHPESHRIYPDHSVENNYNDDMVWHCTACGYAEIREEEDD